MLGHSANFELYPLKTKGNKLEENRGVLLQHIYTYKTLGPNDNMMGAKNGSRRQAEYYKLVWHMIWTGRIGENGVSRGGE